jgi:hypothetical protein
VTDGLALSKPAGSTDRDQPRSGSGRHQIARYFGLTVDRDVPLRCMPHINPMAHSAERYFDSRMGKTFRHQAISNTYRGENIHCALFQNAGANARQNAVGIPALKDDVVDAMAMQDLP